MGEWSATKTTRLRAKRRGQAGSSWYLEETYVKVAGRWCYLYRAIDREGVLLDSMLSEHRDKHAARRFLRRLVEVTERKPQRVTTDKHPPYRRAELNGDLIHGHPEPRRREVVGIGQLTQFVAAERRRGADGHRFLCSAAPGQPGAGREQLRRVVVEQLALPLIRPV